ncbi:MAG: hypothetical protein CMJ33_07570 [Phycisphaerae bacterium]|nr:hypothetical protein [Phycisphaerae bacterium]HAW95605.1 hypothetical protein [Phycisphaerales bacterium]
MPDTRHRCTESIGRASTWIKSLLGSSFTIERNRWNTRFDGHTGGLFQDLPDRLDASEKRPRARMNRSAAGNT